ncbi:MAG: hypothetical protein HY079_05545 [Elusimicrobia bacterium]|nr:hypothetical protein [Elusimicrobiota bacterium]
MSAAPTAPAARLRPFLALALLQAVAFAVFVPRLGFHSDDWQWLEFAARADGLLDRVRIFAAEYPLGRISQVLYYPLAFSVAGTTPWPYHLFLALTGLAESWLLFLLFEALLEDSGLALVAAATALLYPGRAPVHIWINDTPQPVAQVLLLASLLLHERWTRTRRARDLAFGQLLYLGSVLWYESTMFLPLLLAGGLFVRYRARGESFARAARRTTAEMAVFALPLAAGLWWQWAGAARFFHTLGNPKAGMLRPTPGHFLLVYASAARCMTNKAALICVHALRRLLRPGLSPWFFTVVSWPWLLLGAAFVPAATLTLKDSWSAEPAGKSRRAAAVLFAAGFVAAYLPFAVSNGYAPPIFGVDSRVNGAGAWACGLLWSGALFAATRGRPRTRTAAFALLIAVLTWTDWCAAGDWIAAYDLERKVIAHHAAQSRAWPPGAKRLLSGVPRKLGDVGEGPVFNDHWSLGPALRLTTGRRDLDADIAPE